MEGTRTPCSQAGILFIFVELETTPLVLPDIFQNPVVSQMPYIRQSFVHDFRNRRSFGHILYERHSSVRINDHHQFGEFEELEAFANIDINNLCQSEHPR